MNQEGIKRLMDGWRTHHENVDEHFCKKLSSGQDPQYLLLTCSDSRVDFNKLFNVKTQGRVFQVKNVAGLYSRDAKAAFTYALKHLKPEVIVILHHSNCGGYASLRQDSVEEEVVAHMYENRANRAVTHVESFLKKKELKVDDKKKARLIIEEGARIQAARMMGNLKNMRPEIYEEIKKHNICLVAAVYDIEADDIYLVPPSMEDGLDGMRKSITTCEPDEIAGMSDSISTYES